MYIFRNYISSLNIGYRVFSAWQYKIRQRGKKYYVYKVEKDSKGNVSERYIDPLDKIIETYLSREGVGCPHSGAGGI
ncbi:MAG: putative integrase [Saccharolobus sp.]|uniref:putative integrase n=1 Tax=Saccharolobus sp. TaxID=2100761 RepID=UPI0028CEA59A|nr:putative integrase [Saccharolobus sp.]MDT7860868.1 putative integrase [Saccharolobus sp.]